MRRRKVWGDSVQKLKRLFKDEIKPFHVRFVCEESRWLWRPTKGYFTLLFDDAKRGNLLFKITKW